MVALFYAIITPIWWWLSPFYSRALCSAADFIFQLNLLSSDDMTYTYSDGKINGEVVFVVGQVEGGYDVRIAARPVWEGRLFHFSFTVWAALLLASPFKDWRRKLLILLLGWLILFAGQLFSLFIETLSEKSLFLQSSETFARFRLPASDEYLLKWGGRFFLLVGSKLLPLLLWFIWGLPQLLRSPAERVSKADATAV